MTALLVVSIAAFWRFIVTGNALFGVAAGVGWAGMLWLEVVPKIRRDRERRRGER